MESTSCTTVTLQEEDGMESLIFITFNGSFLLSTGANSCPGSLLMGGEGESVSSLC